MSVVSADIEPLTFVFEDDGLVPNNPLPFLVYKGAVDVANDHPEKTIEGLFGANGWGAMWRNGVYDYLHYHSTVHEALGVARGHARVQFGGDHGKALDISAGDVAILPAGTGHQLISASEDFCVVGAYPPGPPMQITRPTPENHAKALKTIPEVKLPKTDPVGARTARWSGCGSVARDNAAETVSRGWRSASSGWLKHPLPARRKTAASRRPGRQKAR